jgi:Bacterial proteasome activator
MDDRMTPNHDSLAPEVVTADGIDFQDHQQPSVSEPSKLIRIASMTRAMLDEVREAPLDDAGRVRLVSIYEGSLTELREVLSDDLIDELDAVFLPINDNPSEAELRIAQAQLVGWLEGLFHGIQASLISQQMSAAAQLDRMRQRAALEQSAPTDANGVYL